MATNTNNYGFKKPEENDFYSIEDQNRNWDLADTKMAQLNSDLQGGIVSITPTSINTPTYMQITFPVAFSSAPAVTVSPLTSAPHIVSASVLEIMATGCKIYLTRADVAQNTSISWVAVRR